MMKPIKIALLAIFSFTLNNLSAQLKGSSPTERLTASETAHSLQNNKGVSTNTGGENLINIDKSGDVSMAIPLVNVVGRKLQLPIQLNYAAGIKVDQKSSAVGLGWNISFGSITRDYGAFEPDYTSTSAEAKMQKSSGTPNNNNYGTNDEPIHTFSNKQNIIYNAITGSSGGGKQKMTPDDYHVNIPGMGSNTFWNNGTEGANHNFVFNEYQPWKIEFGKETYEIDQEYSRINELTFRTAGNGSSQTQKLALGSNIAAAIAVPPYVQNRYFDSEVLIPDNQVGTTNFTLLPLRSKVRYEDFSDFKIIAEDGTQYIFGRALRGQKYVFTESPFWSTHALTPLQANAAHGQFWKIDYIAEWLLTEIRSVDYVDVNNNGRLDAEDEGDWIKIEYTAPTQRENIPGEDVQDIQVPRHREWMNFTQTDKYSSLMRERAYVTKISTPVQEIDFSISKKMDVDFDYFEVPLNRPSNQITPYYYENAFIRDNGKDVDLLVDYPNELMRYDQLVIKEKVQDDVLYPRNKTVNTIVLNYAEKGSAQELAVSNYLIRNNNNEEVATYNPAVVTPGSGSAGFNIENYHVQNYHVGKGRGKTTLLGIDIFPEDNTSTADKRSYTFEYANNPSFDEIKKFQIIKANAFPSLRESNSDPLNKRIPFEGTVKTSLLPYQTLAFTHLNYNTENFTPNITGIGIDEMGYYKNPSGNSLQDRDAWSLTKVTVPTKGTITLEYELDQFDYTADRQAWALADDVNPSPSPEPNCFVDDQLPFVSHFNKLVVARNLLQSKWNSISNMHPNRWKRLNRTYSMPMNSNTGGLRLRKLTLDDQLNPQQVKRYQYGKGHYTAVPGSYWNQFISGFSAFMQNERIIQEHEPLQYHFKLLHNNVASEGFYENDFNTYLSPLSINIRVARNVDDNHYYEYIDEISVQNPTGNNPKIRKEYGSPFMASLPYIKQKKVLIKGYGFWSDFSPITELITNVSHESSKIYLKKVTKYEAGVNFPYESNFNTYTLLSSNKKQNSFGVEELTTRYAPVWAIMSYGTRPTPPWVVFPAYDDKWNFPADPGDRDFSLFYLANVENESDGLNPIWGSDDDPISEHKFILSNFMDITSPIGNPIAGLRASAANMMSFINDPANRRIYRITDDDYAHHEEVIPTKLALTIRMTSQQSTYKNITTNTVYSYEPTYKLLKTTTVENSSYSNVGNGTPVGPQLVNETTYAFEDYNGISSKFTNLNLLSAVSQIKQYYNSVSVSNLLKSSVQTWNVDASNPNTTPRPEAAYVFNNTIDNIGRIQAYAPFNFTDVSLNDDRWQVQNTNLKYNQLGQLTLSQQNDIHTKHVLGYNSSQAKAVISSVRGSFDATYTGFEDHYDNDITYDIGTRSEEEFWYEQNKFDPGFLSHLAFTYLFEDELTSAATQNLPFCTDYNYYTVVNRASGTTKLYRAFYVDNSNDQLKVGDVITIRPNPDLVDNAWRTTQAGLAPFTTTVSSIQELDPIPQVSGTTIVSSAMNQASDASGAPFLFNENYKHMICFSDDIPTSWKQLLDLVQSNSSGNAPNLNGMIIEKASVPRNSRITNKEAHTGNSSYLLSRKLKADDPAQRTPVRPIRIKKLGQ